MEKNNQELENNKLSQTSSKRKKKNFDKLSENLKMNLLRRKEKAQQDKEMEQE